MAFPGNDRWFFVLFSALLPYSSLFFIIHPCDGLQRKSKKKERHKMTFTYTLRLQIKMSHLKRKDTSRSASVKDNTDFDIDHKDWLVAMNKF